MTATIEAYTIRRARAPRASDARAVDYEIEHSSMVTTEKIMYLVVDNAFNRYNYPSLIGKRFKTPPAYASVRKLTKMAARLKLCEGRTTKMAQDAELKFMDDEMRPIG